MTNESDPDEKAAELRDALALTTPAGCSARLGDHVRTLVIGARGMDMAAVEGADRRRHHLRDRPGRRRRPARGGSSSTGPTSRWCRRGSTNRWWSARDPEWTVIVDTIDGTRGLMYDKRPAWCLAAAAPHGGSLRDIVAAAMTELPTVKQGAADQLSGDARRRASSAERVDLRDGAARTARRCDRRRPPTSSTAWRGVAKFFVPGKVALAELEAELFARLGCRDVFDDEYISSGGQLHELISGRDRFVADLRPLVDARRARLPPLRPVHRDAARGGRRRRHRSVGRAARRAARHARRRSRGSGYANRDARGTHRSGPRRAASMTLVRVGSAPGRLDLLGGVADYSGALVLEMPTRVETTVVAEPDDALVVGPARSRSTRWPRWPGSPYAEVRAALAEYPKWTHYVARCRSRARASRRDRAAGASALGRRPTCRSRSACRRAPRSRSRRRGRSAPRRSTRCDSPRCARRPRTTSSARRAGSWTRSRWRWARPARSCRSCAARHRSRRAVPLPAGIEVVGWPTGAEHDVSGAPYRRARAAAFMGKRIVEDAPGTTWSWVSELPADALDALPEALDGAEFLDRWGDTDDAVTTVDPTRPIPVRAATRVRRRRARALRGAPSSTSSGVTSTRSARCWPRATPATTPWGSAIPAATPSVDAGAGPARRARRTLERRRLRRHRRRPVRPRRPRRRRRPHPLSTPSYWPRFRGHDPRIRRQNGVGRCWRGR